MQTIEEVEKSLRNLHLHGMAQTLQARCLQAQQSGAMSVLDVLTQLVGDEQDFRQSRLIERRLSGSGLAEQKIMQDFDWAYNPKLPKREILELISSKFVQNAADDLLDVILERYRHRKSTMTTSNRLIEDWGKFLGDNVAASAILDCLLQRGHLLMFEGKSYRLKEASKRLALKRKTTKLPYVLPTQRWGILTRPRLGIFKWPSGV